MSRSSTRTLGRRVLGSSLLDVLAGPHGVDSYLGLVRPAWSLREVRAEITQVRRLTADSVTLTLRPNANWHGFAAGQYVRLTVEIDGVRHVRTYSPAGSALAGLDHLELTVKRHPEGVVSRFVNECARPGMVVGLSQAEGDFTLPDCAEGLLLVSGGSGITPVMSMLRTLCDSGHGGPVTFLHYARSAADVIYDDDLATLAAAHPAVDVVRVYTRAAGGDLRGHFCREHLAAAVPDYALRETLVCGPSGLVDAVRAAWVEDGIEERLRLEYFTPPAAPAPSGEAGGAVHFAASGVQAANSGASLLEQAEAAGLTPEHGCRMGICHSCTCRKTSGVVRNALTGDVCDAPDEDIQICISVPVGDVALDI